VAEKMFHGPQGAGHFFINHVQPSHNFLAVDLFVRVARGVEKRLATREMTCPCLDAQATGYLPPGSQLAGARRTLKFQVQVTNSGAWLGHLGGEQTCVCKAVGRLEKGKNVAALSRWR
jgi:hypothetical protein